MGRQSPDTLCIRVRFDGLENVTELCNFVESEFADVLDPWPSNLVLRVKSAHLFVYTTPLLLTLPAQYRDRDGDLVSLTSASDLAEVVQYAVCLEFHPQPVYRAPASSLLGDFLSSTTLEAGPLDMPGTPSTLK